MKTTKHISCLFYYTLFCLILLTGCSGSDNTPTTTVSGKVYAAPVTGAVVIVKSGGVEVARSSASAADGSYSIAIPSTYLARDLVFETSCGLTPMKRPEQQE